MTLIKVPTVVTVKIDDGCYCQEHSVQTDDNDGKWSDISGIQRFQGQYHLFFDVTSLICVKENICLRLLMLLLDPGVWSYKVGLLERILVSM